MDACTKLFLLKGPCFIETYSVGRVIPNVVQIQIPEPQSKKEAMNMNHKTLQELQQIYLAQEDNQDMQANYTCHAQIEMIHVREFGWRYESCRACKTKLDEERMCKKCQQKEEFPIQRYRTISAMIQIT